MKKIRAILWLFFPVIVLGHAAKGQSGNDSISFTRKFSTSVWADISTPKHPTLEVKGKRIFLSADENPQDDLVFTDKRFIPQFKNSSCEPAVPQEINLTHCSFHIAKDDSGARKPFTGCGEDDMSFLYNNDISIYNCSFDDSLDARFSITQRANLHLVEDTMGKFSYSNSSGGSLITAENQWRKDLYLAGSNFDILNLTGGDFGMDTLKTVSIFSSRVNTFLFVDNTRKKIKVDLGYHTLIGAMTTLTNKRVTEGERAKSKLEVSFTRCIINAPLVSSFILQKSKIVFDECTFGPGANLTNLGFDSIIFRDCFNIPSPLLLSSDTGLSKVLLSFINSNFTNIKFDYRGKYALFFDSAALANNDLVSGTYENLLAKFKIEGKN